MSRRNSLEKIPQSAHSARNQGRGLNIIDFLTKQNFQDKAPSTILFSDEVNRLKSCDMCLQLQNELDQHVKSDRFQQVIEKLWQKFRKIEDENQKVLIKVGNLERSLIEQQELLQAFNNQFIGKYGLEKPQQQCNYTTLDQEQLDRLERKISKDAQKGIKNIEDNLFKNLNKEIQAKFNLIQDYQLETNLKFTSIFSQIDLLNNKSEIADKINTIEATLSENNKLLNSNKLEFLEMQKQVLLYILTKYSDVDSDLIKIFQHIKTLLQTNYKIDLMEQSINNLKLQLTQIRNSVNEVEDLVSKI